MKAASWGIGWDCVGLVLLGPYLAVVLALLREYEGQHGFSRPDAARPDRASTSGRDRAGSWNPAASRLPRPMHDMPNRLFRGGRRAVGSPPGAVIVAGMVSSPGAASPFLASSSPLLRARSRLLAYEYGKLFGPSPDFFQKSRNFSAATSAARRRPFGFRAGDRAGRRRTGAGRSRGRGG